MEGFTQEDADRVSEKLRSFYDALPDAEKRVLDALMNQAAGVSDVQGYAVDSFIWFESPSSPPPPPGPALPRRGPTNRFALGWASPRR